MEKVANIGDIVGAEEKLGKNRERERHTQGLTDSVRSQVQINCRKYL